MFKSALTLAAFIATVSIAASPALAGSINIAGGRVTPIITPHVAISPVSTKTSVFKFTATGTHIKRVSTN
jgi:hypothetical protein